MFPLLPFLLFFELLAVYSFPHTSGYGEIHAVLIGAAPCDDRCYLNYLTAAETAHTYHLLLEHGVKPENIIVFLNDEITNNTEYNPYPGKLFTNAKFTNDYRAGIPVDYSTEAEITPGNFLAVIQGQKEKVEGGSGRVLKSSSNDRVFISHEGHGENGYMAFPEDGKLTAKDLHAALKNMENKRMYKELAYYVVTCHSGSMFAGHLQSNGSVYAMTAANPDESTAGMDEGKANGKTVYVNSQFGAAWQQDSEQHDLNKETLDSQYKTTKAAVSSSHVSHYGNLEMAKEHIANFQGSTKSDAVKTRSVGNGRARGIPIAPIATYLWLKRKIQHTNSPAEKQRLTEKLEKMEQERHEIQSMASSIVGSFMDADHPAYRSMIVRGPAQITQLDCHDTVVKALSRVCEKIAKSPFIHDFVVPIVNLCEHGFNEEKIVAQMRKRCAQF